MRVGCAFVLGSSSKTVHPGQVLLSKCYETDCGGGTRGEEGQMRPASVLIADTMPEDSGTSLGDARPVKDGNLPTEILLEDTDGLHRPP